MTMSTLDHVQVLGLHQLTRSVRVVVVVQAPAGQEVAVEVSYYHTNFIIKANLLRSTKHRIFLMINLKTSPLQGSFFFAHQPRVKYFDTRTYHSYPLCVIYETFTYEVLTPINGN